MRQNVIRLFAFWVLLLGSFFSWAEDELVENKHYRRAPSSVLQNDVVEAFAKEHSDKVQVFEFFSYACGWCAKLDPVVGSWAKDKPDYVRFERVPVVFQSSWLPLSRAYYTSLALDSLENTHHTLFQAIQSQSLTIASRDTLSELFAEQGVEKSTFIKTFDSFSINRQIKWAASVAKAYKITAIPAIVIQGPEGSFVTNVSMAGSEENVIEVIKLLTEKQKIYLKPSQS